MKPELQKTYTIRDMNKIVEDARRQERKKVMEDIKRISVKLMVKGFSSSQAPVARAYNEGIRDLMKEIRITFKQAPQTK